MAEPIVVVAIPEKEDRVWDYSSEKVPHMTLLYLDGNIANYDTVLGFVKHLVDSMIPRFGLSVDRRGTLGPKDADVLFFEKTRWNIERIKDARDAMIQDDNINRAYNAVDQYPEWTPHLTMGYPTSPAKKIETDNLYDRRINYVNFNRIAIWTSDYEGVEFELSSNDDLDLTVPSSGYWSDSSDSLVSSQNSLKNFLAHHGVNGMRWGYRRRTNSAGLVVGKAQKSGGRTKGSEDHERVIKAISKRAEKGTKSLSTEQIKQIAKRVQAEKELDKIFEEKSQLQKDVDRLRLEKDYAQLKGEEAQRNKSTGRKIAEAMAKKAADEVSKAILKDLGVRIDNKIKNSTSNASAEKKAEDAAKSAAAEAINLAKARKTKKSNKVYNITSLGR